MAVKHIILGTAGHIDHGKTSFIKALTGVDCDRLKEEKERGITIELGYASMTLPSGVKVGIIDVPGHERFVSKMVAGASGVDVVAFIIAADEGVKPQTREHLYICNLLGVKNGIVVVTKKDLVDAELLELQIDDIRDFLKGSVLQDSAIIPVSSFSGDGLEAFRAELDRLASGIAVKPVEKPFRLPVDDVITIKGFGTVIRGTVISGAIRADEEIVLLPGDIACRIRGLQSHGEKVDEGTAGERLAINLADIKRDQAERGMIAARPGFYVPADRLLVEINYLPYNVKPMKLRVNCQFHMHTQRVSAQIFLVGAEQLLPGEKGYAMVRLAKPAVLSWGDTFVIRGYGIYTTMGGGRVLHPALPTFNRKRLTTEYLEKLSNGDVCDRILIFLKERGERGMALPVMCGMTDESKATVKSVLDTLKSKNLVFEDERKQFYHADVVAELAGRIMETVAAFHKANPIRSGINKEELVEKTGSAANLFPLVLRRLTGSGKLVIAGDLVRESGFTARSSGSEELFARIEQLYLEYGLQPEDFPETARKLKVEERTLKEALAAMLKANRMIKVKDDYWLHQQVLEKTREQVRDFFSRKDILTPQDARDVLGLSRKFMIPLLEYLDSIKLTIRLTDGRKLRR